MIYGQSIDFRIILIKIMSIFFQEVLILFILINEDDFVGLKLSNFHKILFIMNLILKLRIIIKNELPIICHICINIFQLFIII
jgi:hypothetical protein